MGDTVYVLVLKPKAEIKFWNMDGDKKKYKLFPWNVF